MDWVASMSSGKSTLQRNLVHVFFNISRDHVLQYLTGVALATDVSANIFTTSEQCESMIMKLPIAYLHEVIGQSWHFVRITFFILTKTKSWKFHWNADNTNIDTVCPVNTTSKKGVYRPTVELPDTKKILPFLSFLIGIFVWESVYLESHGCTT